MNDKLAPTTTASELVVGTDVVLSDGRRVACRAAPMVAGALRRLGHPVRLGALTLETQAGRSPILLVFGRQGQERHIAVDVPTGDRAAVVAARSVLHQAESAYRPRRVLLASPRSFCAGVDRAIEIVQRVLALHGPPVYVRKQIVHNVHVVRDLEQQGAVFVEELDAVPPGATVVFSAHGVSPAVRAEADRRGLNVVDATCPLVTKVHAEARRFAQRGDTIVLIGHEGHEETEGTMGEAPGRTVLVQSAEDVASLEVPDPQRLSYLMQTTLAVDEAEQVVGALRQAFPAVRGPKSEDICYATTNRQNALRAILPESDVLLVIGSRNSSNSVRLVEIAQREGVPAHLVDDAAQIEWSWIAEAGTVGLTAGASAPASLVNEVVRVLGGLGPVTVEQHTTVREDIQFALPRKVVSS